MRILQKVTLLILRVFYVLLFGIRFRIHSHTLIIFYIHVCIVINCYMLYCDLMSVLSRPYSLVWPNITGLGLTRI